MGFRPNRMPSKPSGLVSPAKGEARRLQALHRPLLALRRLQKLNVPLLRLLHLSRALLRLLHLSRALSRLLHLSRALSRLLHLSRALLRLPHPIRECRLLEWLPRLPGHQLWQFRHLCRALGLAMKRRRQGQFQWELQLRVQARFQGPLRLSLYRVKLLEEHQVRHQLLRSAELVNRTRWT